MFPAREHQLLADGNEDNRNRHFAMHRPHLQARASTGGKSRSRIFLVSSARLPLCERPDIGNFTALVGPGIDRPEFVGLAILDHCRIVRTLSE
jgi:hypothetical protein